MAKREKNFDDDSYDEEVEALRDEDLSEEDSAYFSLEESKPPHY